jgi:hypothetical protein
LLEQQLLKIVTVYQSTKQKTTLVLERISGQSLREETSMLMLVDEQLYGLIPTRILLIRKSIVRKKSIKKLVEDEFDLSLIPAMWKTTFLFGRNVSCINS